MSRHRVNGSDHRSHPAAPSPQLKFFAGLWTLRSYPLPDQEWSVAEKFAEAKARGFEAVGGRFVPEAPALCAEHGLEYILYIDADGSNYREQFRQAVDFAPARVNVQLCEHDTPAAAAVRSWISMVEFADKLGLKIDLELHRDTATETPEKAYHIADLFQAHTGHPIRFCLDYSHFAVVKHLAAPFAARLLDRLDLLPPVRQIHLRPFNGHHAQVPATDGCGGITPGCRDFLDFVGALFAALLKTAEPDAVYYACPENGPVGGYALPCFPDVWHDAVRVRDEVRSLWSACVAEMLAAPRGGVSPLRATPPPLP